MANQITFIILLAFSQELLKLGIVRMGEKAELALPAVFAFFVAASLATVDGTEAHLASLGVTGAPLLLFGTTVAVIGPQSFHVFTSVIYWKVERTGLALLFCTAWHVLMNVAIRQMPDPSALAYLSLPFAFFAVNGCIFAGVMRVSARRRPGRRAGEGASAANGQVQRS